MPDLWLCLALIMATSVLGVGYYRSRSALSELRKQFAPIASAEAEASKIKEAAARSASDILQEAQDTKISVAKEVAAGLVELSGWRAQWADELAQLKSQNAKDIAAEHAELEASRRQWDEQLAATRAKNAEEVITAHAALAVSRDQWTQDLVRLQAQKQELASDYQQGKTLYEGLKAEIALLEEHVEDISFGVYRPHFTFQTSDQYKTALDDLWQTEKAMVRNGTAVVCRGAWEVGGSKHAGERMTKQYTKLLLRSFDAECDAAIARVSWNNMSTMWERIKKSFDALNKLGTVMQMEILEPYRDLKLRELKLTHEQEEKKQQEKEEARRVRQQMREEEKVQRELAAAEEEADKEERATEKALDRARQDAAKLDEHGRALMAARIEQLESQLAAAHAQKERVKAQAELTKCGHVYILSNMGSFGEEIVKIGMTRRLEPRERVAELGDASVPFPFDLHTLIYTDDAPALETELQSHFWGHRINLANDRKEFFQVPIADVEAYLCERGLKCTFNRLAEAKEYRQTCSDRERAKAVAQKVTASQSDQFPGELFRSPVEVLNT